MKDELATNPLGSWWKHYKDAAIGTKSLLISDLPLGFDPRPLFLHYKCTNTAELSLNHWEKYSTFTISSLLEQKGDVFLTGKHHLMDGTTKGAHNLERWLRIEIAKSNRSGDLVMNPMLDWVPFKTGDLAKNTGNSLIVDEMGESPPVLETLNLCRFPVAAFNSFVAAGNLLSGSRSNRVLEHWSMVSRCGEEIP